MLSFHAQQNCIKLTITIWDTNPNIQESGKESI